MEKNEVEMVTIPKSQYESLVYDSRVLEALEMGGVSNWEWYEESLKELNEQS